MPKFTKLFFAADIHGSQETFSKFVRAKEIYEVDILVLAGDLTGKLIIPIVNHSDGSYTADLLGHKWNTQNPKEVEDLKKRIETLGYYWYMTDPDGAQKVTSDATTYDEVYKKLCTARLNEWVDTIDKRSKPGDTPVYLAAGNDDPLYIHEVLKASPNVVDAENKVVQVDDSHEMISLGYSIPTPWKTPRECTEEELAERIETLCSNVKNMPNCMFNLHVPPADSGLDAVAQVDETLKANMRKIVSAGSKSVRKTIETHKPLLGLHGHIHEARGTAKIGRTLCLNPGSEYSEGILRGAIVIFDQEKIRGYQFTSG